jgi:MOSC domain-containing protein YiiM
VPELLRKHFPEHGPYLGIYAQVVKAGTIRCGDELRVCS